MLLLFYTLLFNVGGAISETNLTVACAFPIHSSRSKLALRGEKTDT